MTFRLRRRSFLRGSAGALLALPALEIMAPVRARAGGGTIPPRFLVAFGGSSLGRGVPGGTESIDRFVPTTIGADYDLPLALASLAEHGVAGHVSVISGLETPWGPDGAVPPAGRFPMMHHSCYGPLLCGVRASAFVPVAGPTSDQLVADAIGDDTPVHVMTYRVQAEAYGMGTSPSESRMSYRIGVSGELEPVTPKVSPQLVFQELFSGFAPPGEDPAVAAAAELVRRRRISMLDLVADDAEALAQRLGREDRIRMEQHLDRVRDLEQRIEGFGTGMVGEGCHVPADPGADPAIGTQAWSDEDTRARLLCDMIHMAFTCDISRAGSLMFTFAQSGINLSTIVGESVSLHDLGHSADVPGQPLARVEQMAAALGWHVGHFARLVALLRDTQEIDGSSLLDHCALVLVFEGGHGLDGQTGATQSVHSTQNMAALVAGGAGGMLQGRHIVTAQAHPASVVLTAMHAVGVQGSLGEVDVDIPQLFEA